MKRIIALLLLTGCCAVSFGQENRKPTPSMSMEGSGVKPKKQKSVDSDDEGEEAKKPSRDNRSNELDPNPNNFKSGQFVQIYTTQNTIPDVFLFNNEATFEDVVTIKDQSRRDIRYRYLLRKGSVKTIPDGSQAVFVGSRIVEIDSNQYRLAQIRITSGSYMGSSGLVYYAELRNP